jgi:hypothetical protein
MSCLSVNGKRSYSKHLQVFFKQERLILFPLILKWHKRVRKHLNTINGKHKEEGLLDPVLSHYFILNLHFYGKYKLVMLHICPQNKTMKN